MLILEISNNVYNIQLKSLSCCNGIQTIFYSILSTSDILNAYVFSTYCSSNNIIHFFSFFNSEILHIVDYWTSKGYVSTRLQNFLKSMMKLSLFYFNGIRSSLTYNVETTKHYLSKCTILNVPRKSHNVDRPKFHYCFSFWLRLIKIHLH